MNKQNIINELYSENNGMRIGCCTISRFDTSKVRCKQNGIPAFIYHISNGNERIQCENLIVALYHFKKALLCKMGFSKNEFNF